LGRRLVPEAGHATEQPVLILLRLGKTTQARDALEKAREQLKDDKLPRPPWGPSLIREAEEALGPSGK
jgi:hypothetical protein